MCLLSCQSHRGILVRLQASFVKFDFEFNILEHWLFIWVKRQINLTLTLSVNHLESWTNRSRCTEDPPVYIVVFITQSLFNIGQSPTLNFSIRKHCKTSVLLLTSFSLRVLILFKFKTLKSSTYIGQQKTGSIFPCLIGYNNVWCHVEARICLSWHVMMSCHEAHQVSHCH